MGNTVKITAVLTPLPERATELREMLLAMAPLSRAEPGNLRWDVWQEQGQDGRFVLDELYRDNAAVAAHRDTPHFRDYLARIGKLAQRMALVSDPADVA